MSTYFRLGLNIDLPVYAVARTPLPDGVLERNCCISFLYKPFTGTSRTLVVALNVFLRVEARKLLSSVTTGYSAACDDDES